MTRINKTITREVQVGVWKCDYCGKEAGEHSIQDLLTNYMGGGNPADRPPVGWFVLTERKAAPGIVAEDKTATLCSKSCARNHVAGWPS